jgi:hypothetical protein
MGTVVHNGIHHQSHFYHISCMSYFVSPHYLLQVLMFQDTYTKLGEQFPSRRRLLDSTYLTRVNVLKFANLFQSRNKIKLRHLCKFIKIIFSFVMVLFQMSTIKII